MRITLSGGVVVNAGDTILVSERGHEDRFGRVGESMKIHTFKKSKDKGTWLVGVVSVKKRSGWDDLDGQVQENTGTWVTEKRFLRYFVIQPKPVMVISRSHKFRQLDLEGMECVVLSPLPKGNSAMVEFGENIGGCGGDGLGKAGHCLIIPYNKLEESEKKDTTTNKSKG